MPLMKTKVC